MNTPAALFLALSLFTPPAALAANLTAIQPFNVPGAPCAPAVDPHVYDWRNPSPNTIHIVKTWIWGGMDNGAVADFEAQVTRASDSTIIAEIAWDHYAAPVAPGGVFYDFQPDSVDIAPGDGLRLLMYCVTNQAVHSQVVLDIWFKQ